MKRKRESIDVRSKIDSAASRVPRAGVAGRATYSLSAAAADPIRRRLRGSWRVVEHTVGGEPFLDRYAARAVKGGTLLGGEYWCEYEFRDGLCLKLVEIVGILSTEDAEAEYGYRLRVVSSWDLDGADTLAVAPVLGYQYTSLGGLPAAVKELDEPSEPVFVSFRFDGEALVLEEGDDFKRLERSS